ncbi:hypothetical protein D3C87_1943240 [compost metagenome]
MSKNVFPEGSLIFVRCKPSCSKAEATPKWLIISTIAISPCRLLFFNPGSMIDPELESATMAYQ